MVALWIGTLSLHRPCKERLDQCIHQPFLSKTRKGHLEQLVSKTLDRKQVYKSLQLFCMKRLQTWKEFIHRLARSIPRQHNSKNIHRTVDRWLAQIPGMLQLTMVRSLREHNWPWFLVGRMAVLSPLTIRAVQANVWGL